MTLKTFNDFRKSTAKELRFTDPRFTSATPHNLPIMSDATVLPGTRPERRSSRAGRDHWTHCLTDLLAGGGIRGGQTFGSSDRLGEYPKDNPISPADVAHTVYHAMGIRDLQATDEQGHPFNLLDAGQPLYSLF